MATLPPLGCVRIPGALASRGSRQQEVDPQVCLAIPGQVVEVVDESNRLAKVGGAGVRRNVNSGLFEGREAIVPGDWVLIHVGFAISRIDEAEARATRALLEGMGAEYEQELAELRERVIEWGSAARTPTTASRAPTRASRCGLWRWTARAASRCARRPAV